MAKFESDRVNVDVDMSGSENALGKLWKKMSAVGLLVSLIITIVSAVMLAVGFVPCMITFIIGLVMVFASLFSYRSSGRYRD